MTNTEEGSQVLKTDALGRVLTSRTRREELLDEFAGSGLSGRKSAARAGLNYQTFAPWVQARRHARSGFRRSCGGGALAGGGRGADDGPGPRSGAARAVAGRGRLEISSARHIPLAAAVRGSSSRTVATAGSHRRTT